MNQRHRILLIGAAGQVGWELVRSLRMMGEVTPTAAEVCDEPSVRTARYLDLCDVEALRAIVDETRPTIIVNAAAYTAVDKAEQETDLAEQVNARAPAVLAEEARRLGAALIHYSTDYVFDGRGQRAWREDDATGPLGAYGRSKLAGEEAIRAANAAHLILRTSWVYGIRGHNFVRTMLRLGLDKQELRVVCDQFGAPTSARVLADLTCQILAQIADAPAEHLSERGGTLHAACGGTTSWHGFAEEVFLLGRALGMPLAVERVAAIRTDEYATPARRPANSRLDCRRLAERFGLVPPAWETALAETLPLLAAYNFPRVGEV